MLTEFGVQTMVNSGEKFFDRYKALAERSTPFIRSAGEQRVLDSATNWTLGFHNAKTASRRPDRSYPYDILVIPEDVGFNNTLNHGNCAVFEDGPDADIGDDAQHEWTAVFIPAIRDRLEADLPGLVLSIQDTINFMDLCPFNTVASPDGTISPFCDIFTEEEWHQYDYYETLGKWYGYGPGNPLGPTQGVGYVNELIARLTRQPVDDQTTTNHTLDDSNVTFPTNRALYADFSHDNDMTGVFGALGLYNDTVPLSNTSITAAPQTNGYSASWTVPFGARAYFEKMRCGGRREELMRVIVNDRVVPLQRCGADKLGRCTVDAFVESLAFARAGGDWDQCMADVGVPDGDASVLWNN